jgi:hypothetical protein
MIGESHELRQRGEIRTQERDVGSSERDLIDTGSATGTDGHADVGACQGEGVVDPIADHHHHPAGILLGADARQLLVGVNLRFPFIESELGHDLPSDRGQVPREENHSRDAEITYRIDRGTRVGARWVLEFEPSQQPVVLRRPDDRAGACLGNSPDLRDVL